MKQSLRGWIIDLAAIVVGSAVMAAGLVIFTIPNDIAPGGVSGLATALASITPIQVGLWMLIINVPIFVLAWRQLGFRPILKSLIGMTLSSVLTDVFLPLLPPYVNNPLLSAVLGGVLIGVGVGVVLARGASTGGTDTIGLMLIRIFPNASLGTLVMIADAFVVVFAVIIFRDIEVALYSIVTIFVASKAIDAIIQGLDNAKVLHIVTERGGEVTRLLSEELGLGVTVVNAEGGYTHRQKQMLMVVTHRGDFAKTLKTARVADPAAFLFVMNAVEVHGEGFKA